MRLKCWFSGCTQCPDTLQCCLRCGVGIYDYEFYQLPCFLVRPFKQAAWWFSQNKFWITHKCNAECGKRMFFSGDNCCSQKCYDNWIPF